MKPFILILIPLALFSPTPLTAGPGGAAISRVVKTTAEKTFEKSARKTAGRSASKAVQRVGSSTVENAAHASDELLSLAREFGDDAARIEARLPGLGHQAAGMFGRPALAKLAAAPADEAGRVIAYASRADSAATREALFAAWVRRGGTVLGELDKHKALILTGGLTASILRVADGVGDAIEDTPDKVPEAIRELAGHIGTGIFSSFTILAVGLIMLLGGWIWMRRPVRKA